MMLQVVPIQRGRKTRGNSAAGGAGGLFTGRVFGAASTAGLQGAQPLPGGLGGVPPSILSLLLRVSPQAKRAKEEG